MGAQGGTPDDVEVIDDMPPDPNAPPSEAKLTPHAKPFEASAAAAQQGAAWFEQYESQHRAEAEAEAEASSQQRDASGHVHGGDDDDDDDVNQNATGAAEKNQ